MAEEQGKPKDAPLEQVEFDINDINSELAQNAVRDAVEDLNGVRDVQFVGGGAVVTYNPIGIRKRKSAPRFDAAVIARRRLRPAAPDHTPVLLHHDGSLHPFLRMKVYRASHFVSSTFQDDM